MHVKENTNVRRNAQDNNNIALKNSFVIYLRKPIPIYNGGGGGSDGSFKSRNDVATGGVIRVRNTENTATDIKFCMSLLDVDYLSKADVYFEIGENLYDAWVAGGSHSSGITHVEGRIYQITGSSACIYNISVDAGFDDQIAMYFAYKDIHNRFENYESFNFVLRQYDEDDAILGECFYQVRDNSFAPPTLIENVDTLYACNWDMSGGSVNYTVPNASLPYSIYNLAEEEYFEFNESGIYNLLPGDYLLKSTDETANQVTKTTITVILTNVTDVNNTDTVFYNCDNSDSTVYVTTCSGGIMKDMSNTIIYPYSTNHYYLDASNEFYTYDCIDSTTCNHYSTLIVFKDIIQIPSTNSNYLTGNYDRSEHPCCFIDLTDAECDGETPLVFGQEIQIYNMDPTYLYSTNLDLFGGTTLGFWFCPPLWDTSSNVIDHWYSIVVRNDACSYCRMDFMCDSVGESQPFIIQNGNYNSEYKPGVNANNSSIFKSNMLSGQPIIHTGETNISIYPNPANSHVNIKLIGAPIINTIIVYDQTGKSVFMNTYSSENGKMYTTIPLNDFANGVYTIYIPELNYFYKLVLIK
jgi:hypothetical protein